MREMLPREASEFLAATPDALFVDCRSTAEFQTIGHPVGATHIAWREGPELRPNPHFIDEVRQLAGGAIERPVVIICRSGQRSADAACALDAQGFAATISVRHGFEGDPDEQRQRSRINGWRHDGLPWELG